LGATQAEAAHLATGRRGEEEAYFYLRRLGYVMVARNWRSPRLKGELDLIGWDGDVLCFIEVKTRTTHDVKPAEVAVDWDKQRQLSRVAHDYLRQYASRHRRAGDDAPPPFRFDVVSVYFDPSTVRPKKPYISGENLRARPHLALFRNAFRMA
jgi:putative endonuclease